MKQTPFKKLNGARVQYETPAKLKRVSQGSKVSSNSRRCPPLRVGKKIQKLQDQGLGKVLDISFLNEGPESLPIRFILSN